MKIISLTFIAAIAASLQGGELPPPVFNQGERVLFQGDSITDGNRGRNSDPNHILGHGYVFIIAAKYGAAYPDRHLTFINRGVSGNEVMDLAARWQTDALDLKPDVVSILVGVNDVLINFSKHQALSIEDYEKTLGQLLAETSAANSKVKLVLCEPFVLPGRNTSPQWEEWQVALKNIRGVVEKLGAKYHAPVVHFQKVFNDAARCGAPADYWIWDGVHPTYSGHQLMADEWLRVYNEFYGSPLFDPKRNTAIAPLPKIENDSYDWYARHAEVLALQKRIHPDVIMIGDSITHFWAGDPIARRQSGVQAWQDTFGNRKVLNLGFGWDRTQNVLWRLDNGELDGLTPKTIVLNIGCNNFSGTANARANSPEEIAAAVQVVCEKLRASSPASRLVVMGVFPRGNNADDPQRAPIKKLNALLNAAFAGQTAVTFLDIGEKFLAADGSISTNILFDGTHPAEKGYALWGRALSDAGVLP